MSTRSIPDPSKPFLDFITERHLAIITLVRPNGKPHSSPVGFTWDLEENQARIITWSGSFKSRLLTEGPLASSLCQVDGGRWLTIEGTATVTSDPTQCSSAESAYSIRYRPPRDRGNERRVITIEATRILMSHSLR